MTPAPLPADLLASLSGLELIEGMFAGRFPGAPIAALMAMSGGSVGAGWVEFKGHPDTRHYNPLGSVHGGYAATILDSCMGCAVHTTLKAGTGYTTVDLNITYLRAMSAATGEVTARGEVITSGRRIATARGTLTDTRGRLLATGVTTCLILAAGDPPGRDRTPG